MALPAAVAAGAVAAVALPWLVERQPDALGGQIGAIVRGSLVHLGPVHLHWSWPVFAVVTLFAWFFLRIAQRS